MEKRQMRVDWFYRRTGWTSCKKAQEVLGPTEVVEYGNASKEKLSEEQVKVEKQSKQTGKWGEAKSEQYIQEVD